MRITKDARIEIDVSITKLVLSHRRLLALTNKALELLLEYATCITARICKRDSEKHYRIMLIDEKNRNAHQFECLLKGEGVRSELTKISSED